MAQTKGAKKDRFSWSGGQVVWDNPSSVKKKTTKANAARKGKK